MKKGSLGIVFLAVAGVMFAAGALVLWLIQGVPSGVRTLRGVMSLNEMVAILEQTANVLFLASLFFAVGSVLMFILSMPRFQPKTE